VSLRDTVALVTGASSGIGAATARALAANGATVALAARRKDRLDALATEIGGLAIEADLTDREQAEAAVERSARELGRLDIVINNAGVMLLGPIADAPVEEWDRMIELNLQGLLYVAHAALPHLFRAAELEPRRVADLVNVSSVAGRRVGAGGGVYQLTKHGVGTFSEALRQWSPAQPRASSPHTSARRCATSCLRPTSRSSGPRTSPTRSSTSSRDRGTLRSTRSSSGLRSRCARRARAGAGDSEPRPCHIFVAPRV
jgi:NADP-dependent 3-hydroxy acid dehydrogenase YdfG